MGGLSSSSRAWSSQQRREQIAEAGAAVTPKPPASATAPGDTSLELTRTSAMKMPVNRRSLGIYSSLGNKGAATMSIRLEYSCCRMA
jgi:hypothetical protein